jgi:polyferredoxin
MYTNLSGAVFWVAWMMGLVLAAAFAGRAWCAVCPLGAVGEWISRWGLKMPLPRPVRNELPKVLLLVVTLLLLGLVRIHHYPAATAWYLAGWLALAIITGLLFSGRSLCAHLCPVGGMLGQYGRCAPLEIAVKDQAVCDDCPGKECVRGSSGVLTAAAGRLRAAFRIRRHPCPVNLKVWDMNGSDRCLMCFNCMRACPLDNVVLTTRAPAASLWRELYARPTGMLLTAALAGFVMLSFTRFWPGLSVALALPVSMAAGLIGEGAARFSYILWMGFLFPLVLLWIPALIQKWAFAASSAGAAETGDEVPAVRFWMASAGDRAGDDTGEERILGTDSLPGLMATFAPSLIPVVLAGHMVLALVKINAKGGYLPLALRDPAGVRSYMAMEELGTMAAPGLLVAMPLVKWVSAFLVAGGLVLSLLAVTRIGRRVKVSPALFMIPVLAVTAVIAGGLFKWLF